MEQVTNRGRHLLSIADLSSQELGGLVSSSLRLKAKPRGDQLSGKTLALLFEKPSLRTRVSFEMAMAHQEGRTIYLSPAEVGLGKREPIKDVARVLGRMVDAVAIRTFRQEVVEELARYAGIPVINALTDEEHPCQALADLLTIREHLGRLGGVRIGYVGDGNNVAVSLMVGAVSLGAEVTIASPAGYEVPSRAVALARTRADESGGSLRLVDKPDLAAEGADVLYTDVWTSMGQEGQESRRKEHFVGFRIDERLVALAGADAIVMHDLPAHRGEEIEDSVIEGPRSVVFDQAENRLHAQKALLIELLSS